MIKAKIISGRHCKDAFVIHKISNDLSKDSSNYMNPIDCIENSIILKSSKNDCNQVGDCYTDSNGSVWIFDHYDGSLRHFQKVNNSINENRIINLMNDTYDLPTEPDLGIF